MIDIMIITMIVGLILVFMFGIMYYEHYMNMKNLAQHMEYKTVFFNKRKPSVTCTIEKIYWKDLINPRIILNITYQSGNKTMLETTTNELFNLWEIYKE